jgi:hypothetical protein
MIRVCTAAAGPRRGSSGAKADFSFRFDIGEKKKSSGFGVKMGGYGGCVKISGKRVGVRQGVVEERGRWLFPRA